MNDYVHVDQWFGPPEFPVEFSKEVYLRYTHEISKNKPVSLKMKVIKRSNYNIIHSLTKISLFLVFQTANV